MLMKRLKTKVEKKMDKDERRFKNVVEKDGSIGIRLI